MGIPSSPPAHLLKSILSTTLDETVARRTIRGRNRDLSRRSEFVCVHSDFVAFGEATRSTHVSRADIDGTLIIVSTHDGSLKKTQSIEIAKIRDDRQDLCADGISFEEHLARSTRNGTEVRILGRSLTDTTFERQRIRLVCYGNRRIFIGGDDVLCFLHRHC